VDIRTGEASKFVPPGLATERARADDLQARNPAAGCIGRAIGLAD
jgi:hypothetical protein